MIRQMGVTASVKNGREGEVQDRNVGHYCAQIHGRVTIQIKRGWNVTQKRERQTACEHRLYMQMLEESRRKDTEGRHNVAGC